MQVDNIDETVAAAMTLHRQGKLDEAAPMYIAALQAEPRNATALHFLGVLHHQQGRPLLAVDLVQLALSLDPDYVDAYSNLGSIFRDLKDAEAAVKAYEKALKLRPEHPQALRDLASVRRKMAEAEEAAQKLRRAIEVEPDDLQHRYDLAGLYRDAGRPDSAIQVLKDALSVEAKPELFYRLGNLLYGRERIAEAAANYEAWLRIDPESPVAKHMLAACTRQAVPRRADDNYVAQVFNGFAKTFDEVLHRLEYRAPGLIGEALQRIEGDPRCALDIVDAGCGTGLLGEYLRPYARRLVGVDLSTGMLEKAAQRGGYDELLPGELAAYLRRSPAAFDVVASSDTLVYFGDLAEVFAACHGALRSGGRLFFTVEHDLEEPAPDTGYRIKANGRYCHTEAYVREGLRRAGFEVRELERVHLRREGLSYVDGLLVAARRIDATSATRHK